MAIINLTAKQYKSGLKWSLVPVNKIDTVLMQPIANIQVEAAEPIHTESFTSGTLYQQDTVATFPLSEDTPSTHWRWVTYTTPGGKNLAKARVECIVAAGTRKITLDEALLVPPVASVLMSGKSYVVGRGGSTFAAYPSEEDIQSDKFNITTWIKENSSDVNQFLTWNYEDPTVSLNPFVRNWVIDKPPADWSEGEVSPTLPNDITTTWFQPDKNIQYIQQAGGSYSYSWKEGSSFKDTAAKRYMYPVGARNGSVQSGNDIGKTALYIRDLNINTYVGVRKLSDYEYQVSWLMPVRVSYCAATRWTSSTQEGDIDNWAFVDEASDVSIILQGQPLRDDAIDTAFGLDADGNLVSNVSNRHPLKVDQTEAFTLGTTYQNTPWTEKLARNLLEKYENGKYIVECDVSATWALRNLVHVGTEMYVYLLDGRAIKRDGEDCLFSVKNIEKQFNNNEFIFRLKLMEV